MGIMDSDTVMIVVWVAAIVCVALIVTGIVLLSVRRCNTYDRRVMARNAYPARPVMPEPRQPAMPAYPARIAEPARVIEPARPVETARPVERSASRPAPKLSRPILRSERMDTAEKATPIAPFTSWDNVQPAPVSTPVVATAVVSAPAAPATVSATAVPAESRPAPRLTQERQPQEPLQPQPSFSDEECLLMFKSHELLLTLADGLKKLSHAKTEASRKEKMTELLAAASMLDAKSEWDGYKDFFSKMNPGFWKKVQKRTGEELTPYEMRLCAMLSLGMNVKEIAEIGGKSVRTVETAVYKLRKKLDIPAEAKASEFLRSL